MTDDATTGIPTVLFGAFDRHNFGDLLFPHIIATLLARKDLLFAGLAARDLRFCGGHQVSALAQLAAHWGERPVNIIHVGGELLSCEQAGTPATVEVCEIAHGIRDALAVDRAQLRHTATELTTRYRQGFNPICARLG